MHQRYVFSVTHITIFTKYRAPILVERLSHMPQNAWPGLEAAFWAREFIVGLFAVINIPVSYVFYGLRALLMNHLIELGRHCDRNTMDPPWNVLYWKRPVAHDAPSWMGNDIRAGEVFPRVTFTDHET